MFGFIESGFFRESGVFHRQIPVASLCRVAVPVCTCAGMLMCAPVVQPRARTYISVHSHVCLRMRATVVSCGLSNGCAKRTNEPPSGTRNPVASWIGCCVGGVSIISVDAVSVVVVLYRNMNLQRRGSRKLVTNFNVAI